MNQSQVKELLLRLEGDVEDFMVTFTGKKSNKVDGFIVKPYNKSKIFECVDKYLAQHPDRLPKG